MTIPPGSMLSQAISGSPIVVEGDSSTAGATDFDLGFDPNTDPELALALRVSLEEQRHRQEEEARAKKETQETQSAPATAGGIDLYRKCKKTSIIRTNWNQGWFR